MHTQTNSARCPQTNLSSIRTAINKRIRWGTTSASGQKRAMILSFFALGPTLAWTYMGMTIRECNNSVVMEIANRSSIEESIQCLVFNNECHCLISPNETLFLDRCLPRLQLFTVRIIPVISCVLQLFALREWITLGRDGIRFSNPMACVMFPLVSVGIGIAMFSNHCYHVYLGFTICATSYLQAIPVFHDCTGNKGIPGNERRHRNANRWAPPLEPFDNDAQSWKEIL